MAETTGGMNHAEAEELLSAYLDGELTPEEHAALEAHLASCEGCREELGHLERTRAALSGLRQVAAPPNFARQVQRTIAQRTRGRYFHRTLRPSQRAPELALLTMTILVLALLLFALGHGLTSVFVLFRGDLLPAQADAGSANGASWRSEGSWGEVRGGRFVLQPEAEVDPVRLRQQLTEAAQQLALPLPPRWAEATILELQLPPAQVTPFFRLITKEIPLRIERFPHSARMAPGGVELVPVVILLRN